MKKIFSVLALIPMLAFGDTRIIQTDAYGNKQYHKPQYVVRGDRIYETDSIGNTQYHKPQYVIKGDKVYETDSIGNVQYHKRSYVLGNSEKAISRGR